MGKPLSNRAKRRKLERDLAKGQPNKSNIKQVFHTLKYKLNEAQSISFTKSLSENQLDEIFGNILPQKYSDLRTSGHISSNDEFVKEVDWYTNELLRHKEKINLYTRLENKFENQFLSGDYKNASTIIDEIESTICVSQWSIEKRLMIAEYESGFKKNKEVLARFIDNDNDPITNLLSKYQSIRIEKKLSVFKYEEILDNLLSAYQNDKAKEFLTFKLNYYKQGEYKHKGFILSIENSSSLIDKYKSYIQCILSYVSEIKRDKTIDNKITNTLNKLLNNISDNRITNCLYALGETPKLEISENNKKYLEILDNYLNGNYQLVLDSLSSFLMYNSNIFELYEMYIKSTINLEIPLKNPFIKDSFASKCLNDLYNIYSKNEKTQSSIMSTIKTYNALGNMSLSYKLFTFIYNEHNSRIENLHIHKYSNLDSTWANPATSLYFFNSDKYLENLNQSNSYKSTLFYSEINSIIKGKRPEEISVKVKDFRSKLYFCQALQSSNDFELALEKYNSLLNSPAYSSELKLSHNIIEIVYGILHCFINLGKYKHAVELIARYNLINPNYSNRLRFDYLINKIIENDNEDLKSEISTSIVLHQYKSFINPNDIWIAYDEFLNSHNLNYPKEIENIINNLDKDKVVYFLKYICKQDVFDSSYMFDTQDDLDNERIEVCSLLTKIDKENFEEYINEISEINRNILIRRGIKQIDESKIYVDVKGIKNILEKDIKESFDRSMNLQTLTLDQIQKLDLNSDNVIIPYYDGATELNHNETNTSNFKITSYSRFEQFTDMFLKIRDKFIASNEFGIDTYLSMRIRHGTLLGEIRSVFENYYLITKKEDSSDNYKNNLYWQKLIHNSDKETSDTFNNLMSQFSQKIDSISEELKNKKLQIKTEKKESEGFFDYSFDNSELLQLFTKRIASITNYELFFDEIISILWEKTELNLTKIRDDISDNIKETMVGLLVNLSKEVEVIFDKYEQIEVNELIRNITLCQTDIRNELDKIAAWFKRTNSKTINEFYINLPIDSTITTLKRLFKEFQNLEINLNINSDMKFEGENFPHFCYIFQNLLHNIIEHSELKCDQLKVDIDIKNVNDELVIKISNNFSENIDLNDRNDQIQKTRELLLNSFDNDKIRAEKGTGYLKIQKTLKSDLLREVFDILIDSVDNSRIFNTQISFNINNLQKLEK